ncbi:hypothetical protein [Streptomyces sp. NPDC054854]
MTPESSFPDDLLKLQERLHRAHAEHRVHLAALPWSVEPMKGWARGERYSHRGDVPDSPGWSDEQKSVSADTLVESRMRLKRQARPTETVGASEMLEASETVEAA